MTPKILHKRRPLSDETKRKISEAKRGVLKTPEQRARMSAAKKGKLKSLEHREKISLAMEKMWEEKRRLKLIEEKKDTENVYRVKTEN